MECPRCGSEKVERLPPSKISFHPGYLCENCGIKMRSHGMLFVYFCTFLLGSVFLAMAIVLVVGVVQGEQTPRLSIISMAVGGVIGVGYSAMQIVRPVPLRTWDSDKFE